MLKGLSAILAAAVCAGIIVGFVPQPEPAAAATPRPAPREQSNVAINSAPVVAAASACTQTWPYYEQSCLRDGRQVSRTAPTARVIPSGYAVKATVSKQVSKIAKLAGGQR
jgi:hypothetical protein